MQANIIIEILDDKQKVEIRHTYIAKWVSYFQYNLFYENVDQSKPNSYSILLFSNMLVFSSIVISKPNQRLRTGMRSFLAYPLALKETV